MNCLRANRRQANDFGRPRGLESGSQRGENCPHLRKTRRRVEVRREQHEDALRAAECGGERLSVIQLGERNLAATFRPGISLARVTQHGAHPLARVGVQDVGLGAAQAVAAANRKGQTLVTAMNGVPPALRAVKDGSLAMTVELNPVAWGSLGVDVLARYLKGEKMQQQVFIKHVLIDAGNVDELLAKLPKG